MPAQAPSSPIVDVVLHEERPRRHANGAAAPEVRHRARRHRAHALIQPNAPEVTVEVPAPQVYFADGVPVVPNAPAVTIVAPAPESYEVGPEAREIGDSSRRPLRGAPGGTVWLALDILGVGPAHAPAPSEYCVPRKPAMPDEARLRGVTGRVVAHYDVGPDGVVKDVAFPDAPEPLLAGAVRAWLRGCLFEPAVLNGHRVPGRVKQAFNFVLR